MGVFSVKSPWLSHRCRSSTLNEDEMKRGYRDVLKQLHPDYFHGASAVIVKRNEAFITQLNALLTENIPESISSRISALCQLPFHRKAAVHQACLISIESHDTKHEFFRALFSACELPQAVSAGQHGTAPSAEFKSERVPFAMLLSKNLFRRKDISSNFIVQDWRKEHALYANMERQLFLQDISSWILFPRTGSTRGHESQNKSLSLFRASSSKILDQDALIMYLFSKKVLLARWHRQHPSSFWLFILEPDWRFESGDDLKIQDGNYYFKMGTDLPRLPLSE
jgi:hypothetical protein